MSDLTEFQKEHGEQWNAITQHPAFAAAMSHLNLAKLGEISALTDEDIATKGQLLLAGLRDHLKHENDLIALGTKPDLTFRGVGPETYTNPLEEIEAADSNGTEKAEQPPASPPARKRTKRK